MKIGKYDTHPAADLLPLLEGDEYKALCKSIIERGLEKPIELFEGRVLDGRNRLRACLEMNKEPKFIDWKGGDPYEYVWAHNVVRRHLEGGQRAAVRLKFDEALAELAERRRQEGDKRRKAQPRGSGGTFEPTGQPVAPTVGKAKVELAKRADVSHFTAQKAITVQKKAPELFDQVAAGEVKLSAAYRQVQRDEAIERIRKEPEPLPDGKYRLLVVDPPWPYEVRTDDPTHRNAIPYHSMTIEQICALPVGNRAQDDCVLWLWTTNAFLDKAFEVLRAWGFEHKTVLTWDKGRIGAGNWLRGQTEHAIMAVRGKPVVNLTNESTLLRAAPGAHSEKPDEFYELVERLCPGSRLELFARRARPGWVAWGSELDGIVRDGVTAPDADQAEDEDAIEWAKRVEAENVAARKHGRGEEEDAELPRMDDGDWMDRPAGSRGPAEDTDDGMVAEFEQRRATEQAMRKAEGRYQALRAAASWLDRIEAFKRRRSRLSGVQRKALDALAFHRIAEESGHDSRPPAVQNADRALLQSYTTAELAELALILDEENAIRDYQESQRSAARAAKPPKAKRRRRAGGRR